MGKRSFSFFLVILILPVIPIEIMPQQAALIHYGDPAESDSALAVLKSHFPAVTKIQASAISRKKYDLVWLHRTDTTQFKLSSNDINSIKEYVRRGGKLLITLEAFPAVQMLGLEKVKPRLKYVPAADEGYGRKMGFHSFIEHPVFSSLHGGAYIWNAAEDHTARVWGYFEDVIPKGKTAAVDWSYITLKEDSKIILEYELGKGKVLAAGAYTYYSRENLNSRQLKLFTKGCFDYLTGKTYNNKKFFWTYDKPKVSKISAPDITASQPSSKGWVIDSGLCIASNYASDNYWDVAGERILLMGKEKGGIDEVWIHPFMALRDYEAGLIFSYKDTVYWLKDQRPQIEVSPAYIKRVYNFRRAFLTEIISSDPSDPAGVIHYEYRGVFPAKIILKVKSNLRFMWPYSEHAFREIKYGAGKSHFYFETAPSMLSSVFGVSKTPVYKNLGQFEDFEKKDSLYTGKPTSIMQAAGLMVIDLAMNDNFDVTFTGSSVSSEESTGVYRTTLSDPYRVFKRSSEYAAGLFSGKLSLITPDNNFNTGYKWALAGSDKFFVNTPGLGKSLVAGYSTTARGWNGGHKINGRPGYAWYFGRDAQWSGFALLDYGDFEKVREVLNTFNKYQDADGKIYHELTTSGAAHYDAADATPLYIILAGKYFRHSGDIEYLKNNWSFIKKALDYCYSTDTDYDRLIENTNVGHGWVEGGSLYGAHTTLYLASCWAQALREASYMAKALNLEFESDKYSDDFTAVREIINQEFWNEKGEFFYYGKLKDGTYNPEKTVLPAIPLYFNLADSVKAARVLDDYAGSGFTSDWGVRILSSESPLFNPGGYHYGSVWPLFTGWTALAEYRYGNSLQGFSHIMNNLNVYRNFAKGYVEEVLNGAVYKPSGVCPHQCWSETMVLQPIIEGMLGLDVYAPEKLLKLSPSFPADWKDVTIENIRTGEDRHKVTYSSEDGTLTYLFETGGGKFNVELTPLLHDGFIIKGAEKDGNELEYDAATGKVIFSYDKKAEIKFYIEESYAPLPVISCPAEGDSSYGMRIISTVSSDDITEIEVEGKGGTEGILYLYSTGNIPSGNLEGGEILDPEKENIYPVRILFDEPGKLNRKKIKLYR